MNKKKILLSKALAHRNFFTDNMKVVKTKRTTYNPRKEVKQK